MENAIKRRDRHDVVVEILKAAKEVEMKTHIMCTARLSFEQTNRYLDLLIRKGFLENAAIKRKRQIHTAYRITEKGMELLHHMEAVNRLFG